MIKPIVIEDIKKKYCVCDWCDRRAYHVLDFEIGEENPKSSKLFQCEHCGNTSYRPLKRKMTKVVWR